MKIMYLRGRQVEERYGVLINALLQKGVEVHLTKKWIFFDVEDITEMLSAAWLALSVLSRGRDDGRAGEMMRTPWPFHVEGYNHTYFWKYTENPEQGISYGVLKW